MGGDEMMARKRFTRREIKLEDRAVMTIATVLMVIIIVVIVGYFSGAWGKELCQLESKGAGWHYRTQVNGRPERCYYFGERMKSRSELYWAESPKIPPIEVAVPDTLEDMQPPWRLEPRWHPGAVPGWMHKE